MNAQQKLDALTAQIQELHLKADQLSQRADALDREHADKLKAAATGGPEYSRSDADTCKANVRSLRSEADDLRATVKLLESDRPGLEAAVADDNRLAAEKQLEALASQASATLKTFADQWNTALATLEALDELEIEHDGIVNSQYFSALSKLDPDRMLQNTRGSHNKERRFDLARSSLPVQSRFPANLKLLRRKLEGTSLDGQGPLKQRYSMAKLSPGEFLRV